MPEPRGDISLLRIVEAFTKSLTAVKSTVALSKSACEQLPAGAAKEAIAKSIEEADHALRLADAELGESLGFQLCQCTWPPQVMVSAGYSEETQCEQFTCRNCGKTISLPARPRPKGVTAFDPYDVYRACVLRVLRAGTQRGLPPPWDGRGVARMIVTDHPERRRSAWTPFRSAFTDAVARRGDRFAPALRAAAGFRESLPFPEDEPAVPASRRDDHELSGAIPNQRAGDVLEMFLDLTFGNPHALREVTSREIRLAQERLNALAGGSLTGVIVLGRHAMLLNYAIRSIRPPVPFLHTRRHRERNRGMNPVRAFGRMFSHARATVG